MLMIMDVLIKSLTDEQVGVMEHDSY